MERQYKDSGIEWVKRIPLGWQVIKGKHLLSLQNRPVRDTDEVVTCFRDGEVILRSERRTEGFTMSDKEIGYQGVNKGDIVIHGMDGFAGSMGVSKSTGKGSPVLIVCKPKDNDDPRYIIYYLRTLAMNNVFLALATGIRERSCDLRWNKISELLFIRPKDEEQKKIADFIDKKCEEIDSLVELQEQMIAQLTEYKQSVITEAVTKGLDPNAPLVPSGIDWIGDIPKGWGLKKVKFIADSLSKGNGITKEEVFKDGDTPCVRYGEIYSKYNHSFNNCVSATNIKIQKSPHYFKHGDILCAGTGELVDEIGKSIVYLGDKNCLAGGDIIVIRHHQNPSFLNYALNSHYAQMQKSKGKAKLKVVHISAYEIGSILIMLPSLSEQHAIASYLDKKCSEIDDLIAMKQKKIEMLKEYKKSVIYEAVTGKTLIGEGEA